MIDGIKPYAENLGEFLTGDKIENSAYDVRTYVHPYSMIYMFLRVINIRTMIAVIRSIFACFYPIYFSNCFTLNGKYKFVIYYQHYHNSYYSRDGYSNNQSLIINLTMEIKTSTTTIKSS